MLENFRIKTLKQVRQFKERGPLQSSIRQDSESTLEQDSPQKDQNLPTQRVLFPYQTESMQISLKPTIIKMGSYQIQPQNQSNDSSESTNLLAITQFLNRVVQKTAKIQSNFKQFDSTILDKIPNPGQEADETLISCQMNAINELFKEIKSLQQKSKQLSFSTLYKLQAFNCDNVIDAQQVIWEKVSELMKKYEDSSSQYDNQVKTLQKENIAYSKQIIELKQQIEVLKCSEKEKQDWTNIKKSELQKDTLSESNMKIQEENDLKLLNDKLEEENKYLKQNLQQYMTQIQELKQNQELIIQQYSNQIANFQNKINQKDQKAKCLQEELNEIKIKNQEIEEDLQNLENSYGDLWTKYNKLKSIAEDDAQVKELYIQELMEQKEELEQIEEDFKESEIDYEKQIEEKDQKIEKLQKEVERIKKIDEKFKRESTDQLQNQIQPLKFVHNQSSVSKLEENQLNDKNFQDQSINYKKLYENLDKTFKKLIQFKAAKVFDPKLRITNDKLILPAISTQLALSQLVRVTSNLEKVPDEKYKFVQNLMGQEYYNNLI